MVNAESAIQLVAMKTDDRAIALSFVEKYYSEDHLQFVGKVKLAVEELLAHPEWGRLYRVVLDDVSVGYVGLTYAFDHEVGGRFGTITDFYIDPNFRGHGIGTAVLSQIVDLAKSLGLKEIGLVVLDHNERVRPLYERHGFRRENGRGWMWLNLDQN